MNKPCTLCGTGRLDTPQEPVRGPYCNKCWLELIDDAAKDYLLERIANLGADVEHLRTQEPAPRLGELMALFNNVWEAKHALEGGAVQ